MPPETGTGQAQEPPTRGIPEGVYSPLRVLVARTANLTHQASPIHSLLLELVDDKPCSSRAPQIRCSDPSLCNRNAGDRV
ncbi:hypothetical protein SRHO_G00068660 [Serrasalmus rhombeus]